MTIRIILFHEEGSIHIIIDARKTKRRDAGTRGYRGGGRGDLLRAERGDAGRRPRLQAAMKRRGEKNKGKRGSPVWHTNEDEKNVHGISQFTQ